MDASEYKRLSDKKAPKSPTLKNCIWAFFVGGAICTLGEAFLKLYQNLGIAEKEASALVSVTLILLSMIFTGLGLYSKLAKRAGAGTLVPITGFANAVASSAIEAKSEGYVLGVGANIFKIAGPVIVFGITASAFCGAIYFLVT
ncbi:MAG: stage V sporulation protein AC [Clostridia bacterium]|nr:stage V sporulation protein AC [Clostridia bacterium]